MAGRVIFSRTELQDFWRGSGTYRSQIAADLGLPATTEKAFLAAEADVATHADVHHYVAMRQGKGHWPRVRVSATTPATTATPTPPPPAPAPATTTTTAAPPPAPAPATTTIAAFSKLPIKYRVLSTCGGIFIVVCVFSCCIYLPLMFLFIWLGGGF